MKPKLLFILLLALFATAEAQSDDDLPIPDETDNQFPPVIHNELDVSPIEGSGAEAPLETTTISSELPPQLEDVQLSSSIINNENVPSADKLTCPTKCICNIEGNSDNYIVDCSDAELTELPTPLDAKTTQLNLQNNLLNLIPKDISELKNLRILNVNNNKIMDVAAGSISELPELTSLTLRNNRLMEYPTDLKNSFGLTKLEEFDLGGNDMRTVLKPESFSIFKALRKLILPSATPQLVEELCGVLKESLEAVCIESCNNKQHDCPDAPENIDDLDIVLPALIPSETDFEESEVFIKSTESNVTEETLTTNEETSQTSPVTNVATTMIIESAGDSINAEDSISGGVSFHSAVLKAPVEETEIPQSESNPVNVEEKQVEVNSNPTDALPQPAEPTLTAVDAKPAEIETKPVEVQSKSTVVEPKPTEVEPNPTDSKAKTTVDEPIATRIELRSTEVNSPKQPAPNSNIMVKSESGVVEATTSSAKTGGVDKSIIAIVVAGMVLIVAGITIKKNWSSIKKRFSSAPRNDNNRTGINTNGTAPEEVPLQEKSPV